LAGKLASACQPALTTWQGEQRGISLRRRKKYRIRGGEELVSKPYLNVIPGSTRCRMAVVTRNLQILNPQSSDGAGKFRMTMQILNQVQNDKVDPEHPSDTTG